MAMEYSMQIEGLDQLLSAMAEAGGNAKPLMALAMKASVLKIQSLAREKAPHRTGTLQRSIQAEYSDLHGEVKVIEKYGLFIEQGTGIYGPEHRMIEIRPRNKKALFWPGAAYPVKLVRQKGQRARPFFQPAITEAQVFIRAQFQQVADTIVRQIAEKARH